MRMQPIIVFLGIIAFLVMGYTFSLGWRYHYGQAELDRLAAELPSRLVDELEIER